MGGAAGPWVGDTAGKSRTPPAFLCAATNTDLLKSSVQAYKRGRMIWKSLLLSIKWEESWKMAFSQKLCPASRSILHILLSYLIGVFPSVFPGLYRVHWILSYRIQCQQTQPRPLSFSFLFLTSSQDRFLLCSLGYPPVHNMTPAALILWSSYFAYGLRLQVLPSHTSERRKQNANPVPLTHSPKLSSISQNDPTSFNINTPYL